MLQGSTAAGRIEHAIHEAGCCYKPHPSSKAVRRHEKPEFAAWNSHCSSNTIAIYLETDSVLKEGVVAVLSQAQKAEQQLPDNEVHHTHSVGPDGCQGAAPALPCPCTVKGWAVIRTQPALGCRTALPEGARGHQGTPQTGRATQAGHTELCCPGKWWNLHTWKCRCSTWGVVWWRTWWCCIGFEDPGGLFQP